MSVLVIDKPVGPSSFAVVRRVRHALACARGRVARSIKIGHGGTLDPMASGVLPVCVGEATKIVPFLLDADKEYEAEVRFGVETDTLDATGKVLATSDVGRLDAGAVGSALSRFRGPIEQVPPMYSALKRGGRPLYSYARAGQTVERAPRRVTVYELELVAFAPPDRARLRIRCSKGTYVRSLASDLGRELGVGAHLAALRRTASGPFRLDRAVSLADVEAAVESGRALPFFSLREALAHLPAVIVGTDVAAMLARGQRPSWDRLAPPDRYDGPLCVLCAVGGAAELVAVVKQEPAGIARVLRGFDPSVDSARAM